MKSQVMKSKQSRSDALCLLLFLLTYFALPMQAQDLSKALEACKDDTTGLWGYINESDSCQSPWYRRANRVKFGFMGVGGGSKTDLLNHGYDKEWVISAQYEDVSKRFSEGLAAVQLHGKVGFVDAYNRFVIEPSFEPTKQLEGFSMGLAAVRLNGKYGFIDKKGNFVIKPVYEYAENFRDSRLATIKQDGKFGAINLNGEIVVPCKYILEEAMIDVPISNKAYRAAKEQAAKDFSEGKYAANIVKAEKAAQAVDRQIGNAKWNKPGSMKLRLKTENGAVGAYTADGRCVISPIYEEIVPQGNGVMLMCANDKWGACDIYGRIVMSPVYDIVTYDKNARLFVVDKGGRMGLYATTGRMILPPCLDAIGDFSGGKAMAYINNECGLVNTQGEFSDSLVARAFVKAAALDEAGGTRAEILPLYTQILLAQPDYAMAHNNIGIMDIEGEDYKEGMRRLKVAHKLEPGDAEIAANLKQAKKDRNQRRWNRIGNALEIAAVVIGVAATTYAAVEGVSQGSSGTSASAGYAGSVDGGASSGGDCSQVMAMISKYEGKLANEQSGNASRIGTADAKNAGHRIAPDMIDGATPGDYRVINSSKKLSRTYQRRIDELKREARKKGCL